MNEKTHNNFERYSKYQALSSLFMMSAIVLMMLNLIFKNYINDEFRVGISILTLGFFIPVGWFSYKTHTFNKYLFKDKKLIEQHFDERAINIEYKSKALAYMSTLVFLAIYVLLAMVQKTLFSNNFLFEIEGFYIAILAVAIGGIASSINTLISDKNEY